MMEKYDTQIFSSLSNDFRWANERNVYLSSPFLSTDIVVAYKKDVALSPRYALPQGYYISDVIRKQFLNDVTIEYFKNPIDCMEAVHAGEADYTLLTAYEMEYFLKTPKYHTLSYRTMQVPDFEISIGTHKSEGEVLHSIIEKGLNSLSPYKIQEIIRSHITAPHKDSLLALLYGNPLEFWLLLSVVVLFISACIILSVLYMTKKKQSRILKEASEAKSMFISRVSHDMRTPMNGILGIAELSADKNNVQELKDDIEQIKTSGEFLLNLINDTLDISRIENGKLILHEIICSEESIFRSILQIVRPRIDENDIEFEVSKANFKWHTVLTDKQRLQQIFINLLTNAIKFTPKRGKVSFIMETLWENEQFVRNRFIIKDNGIGMSEDFQAHLFEAFSQENKINTDREGGTGLGLSIVKSIVELMQGTLEIKSKENVGTSVIITLTLKIAKEEEKRIEISPLDLSLLNHKHILLFEDNDLNARIISKLLYNVGIEVIRVQNGAEGVDLFKASPIKSFDLVLMDIRMPIMDGYEATKIIRIFEKENNMYTPIVALSANALKEDVEKSKKCGMDEHLSKPIHVPSLRVDSRTF